MVVLVVVVRSLYWPTSQETCLLLYYQTKRFLWLCSLASQTCPRQDPVMALSWGEYQQQWSIVLASNWFAEVSGFFLGS